MYSLEFLLYSFTFIELTYYQFIIFYTLFYLTLNFILFVNKTPTSNKWRPYWLFCICSLRSLFSYFSSLHDLFLFNLYFLLHFRIGKKNYIIPFHRFQFMICCFFFFTQRNLNIFRSFKKHFVYFFVFLN